MAISKDERQSNIVSVESNQPARLARLRSRLPGFRNRGNKPRKDKRPAGQMTFFEHLGELRNRLIWAGLAVILGSIVGFIFSRDLVGIFVDLAKPTPVVTLNFFDQFGVYMNIALYVGILLASPVIVYQVMAFLAPALEPESMPGTPEYAQELKALKSIRRSLLFFIPFVAISFAVGVAFAYYIVIPQALHFLLDFSKGQLQALLDAQKYISQITQLLFWVGVSFELPIFIFLLAKVKIVTFQRLIKWWKWALVFSLVAAAFITPSPDIFNQAIIAIPIFCLYWLGVLFARFA